jgi:SAM-dependent methyltransferase
VGEQVSNPFDSKSAAKRYAAGRVYFHDRAIGIFVDRLGLKGRLSLGVDVGCGTGLSTRALREIVEEAVGVDIAPEMIELAPRDDAHIRYAVAPAENLPIADRFADIMTLSCVFHWINQQAFLSEARRILLPGGMLVIINHGFAGKIVDCDNFEPWARNVYPKRYPPPPRNNSSLDSAGSLEGFDHVFTEQFQHNVDLSAELLINYLLTQSNIIAAVERGRENIDQVRSWLANEIGSMFGNTMSRPCTFQGHVTCQRRKQ